MQSAVYIFIISGQELGGGGSGVPVHQIKEMVPPSKDVASFTVKTGAVCPPSSWWGNEQVDDFSRPLHKGRGPQRSVMTMSGPKCTDYKAPSPR